MIRELPLVRGGLLWVLEADSAQVAVEATAPSPPGSTLEAIVADARLGIKVRSCRRSGQDESRFRIEGRWVGLSRVQREALGLSP